MCNRAVVATHVSLEDVLLSDIAVFQCLHYTIIQALYYLAVPPACVYMIIVWR
jgi:hypothetical protein